MHKHLLLIVVDDNSTSKQRSRENYAGKSIRLKLPQLKVDCYCGQGIGEVTLMICKLTGSHTHRSIEMPINFVIVRMHS